MAIKTHLISPACYKYLQSLNCISLPHVYTLEKLYASCGLENDFCTYLRHATSCFSPEGKNVIVQMDEIHFRSDISYKGGKIYGPNLTQSCGFKYMLFSFPQTDPLEHHFGLYRMMSGSNYHISYLQILETERRLKLSSILNIFTDQQDTSFQSIQSFVNSFSCPYSTTDGEYNLEPFLDEINDLSTIDCGSQLLQSLAFIAGYSVHQYLKQTKPCHVCLHKLTVDKEFLLDLDLDSV